LKGKEPEFVWIVRVVLLTVTQNLPLLPKSEVGVAVQIGAEAYAVGKVMSVLGPAVTLPAN
jgi:hypothetical protein